MYTHVKICGITNVDDALVATEAGADYLGLNFYSKSPRYVTPEEAREIAAAVRRACRSKQSDAREASAMIPRFAGVFVNLPSEQIRDIVEIVGLDFVQLHGDETPSVMAAVSSAAYKVLRPKSREEAIEAGARFVPLSSSAGPQLLVDAYTPDAYGGTGQRTDWEIAAELATVYPRLMLAGGLNADNVAEAVAAVLPWGVDVSSGVESAPGRKDGDVVRAFVANARTASTRTTS